MNRREFLAASTMAGVAGSQLVGSVAAATAQAILPAGYTPVVTPNGSTLPWKMENGVKVFHLIAEPVKRELTPGLVLNCWGYNGQTPGPTIEAVEGDRVRLLVTNRLPEPTSVHWHGLLLPNGMDGVAGLNQPHIQPGETYAYEFTLRQHGTQMYHPHSDEMVQIALGMMGFFIIHPRTPPTPRVDRDFAIFLHEWAVDPGSSRPRPNVMTDFSLFTFNSRVFPGTEPLVVRLGQRVRIRIGNISMDSHPIHLHGHRFEQTGTDGGPISERARLPETTVNVPPGTTRDIEFIADNPGDWAFHCHKSHHTMNQMGHETPNMIGVRQEGVTETLRSFLPGYMPMGENGMGDMAALGSKEMSGMEKGGMDMSGKDAGMDMSGMQMGDMGMSGPKNSPPMMAGDGPFGAIEMGGMFTVVKIRAGISSYADPGWYKQPAGTAPRKVETPE